MKLLSLVLDNFKGIKQFSFIPGGKNADIFGDNGTGKTTLDDAYFWLLFGKDSSGRSDTNFDVKTRGTSGLDYSVSGEFKDDAGHIFTLRRVYKEKFSRENGAAEREKTGNTTDFFINDVPKPKKDYTAFVASICDEQTFMLLTDPDMFPGKLKWSERRAMLTKWFAPDVEDREIINAHDDLKPLLQYIGYKSVDDYAEITKAQRQKINKRLAEIPGRIDEAEKAKPAELPEESDGPMMARLASKKMKLEAAIQAARSGEAISTLRKEIADIQAEIAEARTSFTKKFSNGNSVIESEAKDMRYTINGINGEISALQRKIAENKEFLGNASTEIEQLRNQWVDENEKEPSEDNICPVCGQAYAPEKVEKITSEFNEHKAQKLEKIQNKANDLKDAYSSAEELLQKHTVQLEEKQESLKVFQERLEKLSKSYVTPPNFEDSKEYVSLSDKLSRKLQELSILQTGSDSKIFELNAQLDTVTVELDAIKRRALSKEIIEQQDKRIEELKAEERELAQTLAVYDNGLLLAEKFVQTKASDIEEKVNSAFQIVHWKLFDVQENGGIKACCEATVDQYALDIATGKVPTTKSGIWVEYNTNLNSAAKLNAGLDIINTLSKQVGIDVPIWIDNAESVTSFLPINAQTIRLHVSEADKKLRAEVRG